jgi:nicotinamide phosphoribosyltransferase
MNTKYNHTYNPILDTDSYKISHHLQYPDNTTEMFTYIESRGGQYDKLVFFGLQYIVQKYLTTQITPEMIDEAENLITQHGLGHSFNLKGWQYIVDEYEGYIPVTIKAVPEGTVVDTKNVLVTIHCSDPKAFWIVSYIETLLLRVWYPITVATKSFHIKNVILKAAMKSSCEPTVNLFALTYSTGIPQSNLFKFHDFSFRGVSSLETAGIGGAAHLVNFLGTDTLAALLVARDFYDEPCAGYSIDASEHSTMTALGPQGEFLQFERMINQFGDRPIFACVSDGFDIYNAIENGWGGQLKQKVIDMNAILVVRPDSGDPISMPIECIKLLDKCFGHTVNEKGYKVLNHVRVIQGDGIDEQDVENIFELLLKEGYSTDNLAIGMGGGLCQKVNRDTLKFACKNSWMRVNGEGVNVFKDPITDPGKKSKKGRMTLIEHCHEEDDGVATFETVTELTDVQFENSNNLFNEVLVPIFKNGRMLKTYTLKEIRLRTEQHC